jgi:hypothetical protein
MSILRFVARLVFRLFIGLVGFLLSLALPIILAILHLLQTLMFTSISAIVHGPGLFIERIASRWTLRLLSLGVSRDYLDQLYGLCRFFATSEIVLGWVITALFSVAILRVVFGFFI